jgi:acetyl esterase
MAKLQRITLFLTLSTILLCCTTTFAQQQRPQRPKPTHANVSYGAHERNVVDFYQAESISPTPVLFYFHGGGFRQGDKGGVNRQVYDLCMENGISMAAANYRLTGTDPYPAQMHDCARALQFVRSKAKEWNIDAERFVAFGGSAGAGISLWLGFHDDMADPNSDDPVARQSTRLRAAIGLQAQCTYDSRVIRKIIPGNAWDEPALKPLFGLPANWDWNKETVSKKLSDLIIDASSITHLTPDDPPVFVYHRNEQDVPGNIHHGNFGRHLKKVMDGMGLDCTRSMTEEYKDKEAHYPAVFRFAQKHLRK